MLLRAFRKRARRAARRAARHRRPRRARARAQGPRARARLDDAVRFLGHVTPVQRAIERVAGRRRAVARRGFRHGRARGDGARAARDRGVDRRARGPRPRRRDGPARRRRRRRRRLPTAMLRLANDPEGAAEMGAPGAHPRGRALPRGPLHRADRGGLPLLAERPAHGDARAERAERHPRDRRRGEHREQEVPRARGSASCRRRPTPRTSRSRRRPSTSTRKRRGTKNAAGDREQVERDHVRGLRDRAERVDRAARLGRALALEHRRLPEQHGRLPHQLQLLARVLAPERPRPRPGRAPSARTRRRRARSARPAADRRRARGQSGAPGTRRHVVDPAPVGEQVVGLRVVRLPERARVGRDREAARPAPGCARPTARPRAPPRRAPRAPPRPAGLAPEQVGREQQRQQQQPRVREDREPRDGAERRPPARASRRSAATSASSTIAAPSSWSRISRFRWTSCQTRYGCSVAIAAASRPRARLRRDAAADLVDEQRDGDRDRDLREPDREPRLVEEPVRSGSGRTRRAAACSPTACPATKPNVPLSTNVLREVPALLDEGRDDVAALVRAARRAAGSARSPRRARRPAARHAARRALRRAAATSTCVRCQSSSMQRHQSRCPWSARPLTCSSSSRFSSARRKSAAVVAAEQEVARERSQLLAEPAVERDAEARLAAGRDLGRQVVRERQLERLLARARAPARQREAELDDAVVEERRAQLERDGHRRDVGLRQQVAREVATRCRRGAGRRAPAGSRRVALRERLVRPEPPAQLEREDLDEPRVALRLGSARPRRGSGRARKSVERGSRRARGTRPSACAPTAAAKPGHAARRARAPGSARSRRRPRRLRRRRARPSRAAASPRRRAASAAPPRRRTARRTPRATRSTSVRVGVDLELRVLGALALGDGAGVARARRSGGRRSRR